MEERYMVPLNFISADTDEVREAINYLNSKARNKTNYFVTAYKYSKQNGPELTDAAKLMFEIYKLQYIKQKYKITGKENLIEVINSDRLGALKPLPAAKRLLLTFHCNDEDEMDAYEFLNQKPNKTKISEVVKTIRRYAESGDDIGFLEYSSVRFLQYLKQSYSAGNVEALDSAIEVMNIPVKSKYNINPEGEVIFDDKELTADLMDEKVINKITNGTY